MERGSAHLTDDEKIKVASTLQEMLGKTRSELEDVVFLEDEYKRRLFLGTFYVSDGFPLKPARMEENRGQSWEQAFEVAAFFLSLKTLSLEAASYFAQNNLNSTFFQQSNGIPLYQTIEAWDRAAVEQSLEEHKIYEAWLECMDFAHELTVATIPEFLTKEARQKSFFQRKDGRELIRLYFSSPSYSA